MEPWSVLFGIWFGVGCYRLFEMIEFDGMEKEDPAEEWGVHPITYFIISVISAYGWPVLMPYAYWLDRREDEDEN
jgi:hypothetical protein